MTRSQSKRCASGDPVTQCQRIATGTDDIGLPACDKHRSQTPKRTPTEEDAQDVLTDRHYGGVTP